MKVKNKRIINIQTFDVLTAPSDYLGLHENLPQIDLIYDFINLMLPKVNYNVKT